MKSPIEKSTCSKIGIKMGAAPNVPMDIATVNSDVHDFNISTSGKKICVQQVSYSNDYMYYLSC